METLKLRKVQQPSRVAELLDLYISNTNLLSGGAYQVHDLKSLPRELRGLADRVVEQGDTWACWAQGSQIWLFTASMCLASSRERGAPVLQISFYGDDAALKDSGMWMVDQQKKWHRCSS